MPLDVEAEQRIIDRFVGQLNEEFQKRSDTLPPHASRQKGGEWFTITRLVAPSRGDERPDDSEFFPVLCRDISAAGMSFWCPERPPGEWFAVKFEINGEVLCVKAHVVRVSRDFDLSNPPYMVECEFRGQFEDNCD